MGLARRLIRLTLSRLEWEEIATELSAWPESAAVSSAVVRDLQARLAASRSSPDQLITFSQSALSWAPLVLALALQVRRDPGLLPVAEHIQGQIQAQVKRFEGPVRPDSIPQLRPWPGPEGHDLGDRLNRN